MNHLPSVDKIVSDPSLAEFEDKLIRPVRVRIVRKVIEKHRAEKNLNVTPIQILQEVKEQLSLCSAVGLRRAINATGIVLHTNLGRAPLGKKVLRDLSEALWGYSTLELDTETGERGKRGKSVEEGVALITGAEAALVVNNNAAAVWLALFGVARGKEVLISRSELVQIGGGFKVPEILEAAGAKLVEVGTTNMTSLADYQSKFSGETAAILRVHQSNFVISGHTKSTSTGELVKWGKTVSIPVIEDLGSGDLGSSESDHHPSVAEALHRGVSLVAFSGDKILGGPQAGIIVGERKWIERLKSCPLYRAMRLGKTELFLLESMIRDRLQGKPSVTELLLSKTPGEIREAAEQLKQQLSFLPEVEVKEDKGSVGGGAWPGESLPTWLVEVKLAKVDRWHRQLLSGHPAVVCRRNAESLQIDLRTVWEEEMGSLVKAFREADRCLSSEL